MTRRVPNPVVGTRAFLRTGILLWFGIAAAAGAAHAADPGKGRSLYTSHCMVCHGERGEPVWPGAPDFRRPGALLKTDAQFLTLLRQGRGVMPGYMAVMRDRDMLDLMAFLRTLN